MLKQDLEHRFKVDELRIKYPHPLVTPWRFINGILRNGVETMDEYKPWLMDVLTWMFDECHCPVGNMVDWTCLHFLDLIGDDTTVLDFFLRRRKPTSLDNLDLTLLSCMLCGFQNCTKRLLDAGAKVDTTRNTDIQLDQVVHQDVLSWYHSRQAARAAIYAFLYCLSPRSGRQDLRACAPRDIQNWIARLVWAGRFN